jgi:tRNA(fMet)-specific endonuclease VapC
MSLYMLHTDIATDLIHGSSAVLDSRIAASPPQQLCISAVTRGALLCGLSQQWLRKKHDRSAQAAEPLSRLVEHFLARVPSLPWDDAAAEHFAMIAVTLHHAGTPIGNIDTMIAAHAIALGAVLVTSREDRFLRVAGLQLEAWTAA